MGWVGLGWGGRDQQPRASGTKLSHMLVVGRMGGEGVVWGSGGEGVNGAGIYSYSNLAREYENREGQQ